MPEIGGFPGNCGLSVIYNITGRGYGQSASTKQIKEAMKDEYIEQVIATTFDKTVSKNLIAAGLPIIGSYAGHNGRIYVHATFGKKKAKKKTGQ